MSTFMLWILLLCGDNNQCRDWWDRCLETAYDNYADVATDIASQETSEDLEIKSIKYCLKNYEVRK